MELLFLLYFPAPIGSGHLSNFQFPVHTKLFSRTFSFVIFSLITAFMVDELSQKISF